MSRRVVSQGTSQPRSQSSSAISDVTSSVKLALVSKRSLVTRIAQTGLGTRLGTNNN